MRFNKILVLRCQHFLYLNTEIGAETHHENKLVRDGLRKLAFLIPAGQRVRRTCFTPVSEGHPHIVCGKLLLVGEVIRKVLASLVWEAITFHRFRARSKPPANGQTHRCSCRPC